LDRTRSLALQLLQGYNIHVSTGFLTEDLGPLEFLSFPISYWLSRVQCISFFRIVEIVGSLIEVKGYDTKKGCYIGDSPLVWTTQNGHEEVVEILVGWEGVYLHEE